MKAFYASCQPPQTRCDHCNHQRRMPPPPNPQAAYRLHRHKQWGNPQTLRGIKNRPRTGLGSTRMGTTPGLGTAAAAEPATSKRGMTLIWASLPHPVREYASPPPITLTTMNYETSKTSTEKVRTMFIIISTNVCCGT